MRCSTSIYKSFASGFLTLSVAPFAFGQTPDKAKYNLFNPTPEKEMRELSTDRPDKTESPYTVDAGHFQIETDLISQSMNSDDESGTEVKSSSTVYVATNLKVGLTNNIDLQLVLVPHQEDKVEVADQSDKEKGFGDTTLRMKINLIGNDEGPFAIALMPFVKIPTADEDLGNEEYEGGVILPVGIGLPGDWGLGLMLQLNYEKNALDKKYHNVFVTSITTSHAIAGDLGFYVEFFSETSGEDGAEWVATFDAGLTYGIGTNTQLDLGSNTGITDAADDQNWFVGISHRI